MVFAKLYELKINVTTVAVYNKHSIAVNRVIVIIIVVIISAEVLWCSSALSIALKMAQPLYANFLI